MKAIICGAGIAGLSCACFLGRQGWETTIVEKAPGLRTAGYMLDFFGSGYDAAEAGGLLPALQHLHHPVDEVIYVGQDGRHRSLIDYRQFRESLDGRLLALLRGDIERALFEALPEGSDIRYGTSIASVDGLEMAADVALTDGKRLSGDVLIGADGIHSRVRELVFGPERQFVRHLGYHTAAFVFQSRALERALGGHFMILSLPKRQLGLYATGNGEVTAFFAHSTDAPDVPDDPVQALTQVYGDLGWHAPAVLEALKNADDIYYDVVAQIEMPAWRSGRAILVGDAAWAVSLLAGQGASLAVAGGYLLARMLADEPVEAALARFENRLKPAVAEKQAAGRKTADWFVPPTAFHNALRDVFLNLARTPMLSGLLARFFAPSVKSVVR